MENHVIGPPGAGKTAYLAGGRNLDGTWREGQVARAVAEYGYDRVLVTSLTKAAVHEIVGRDLPIPRNHAGTLHSLAYHALGGATMFTKRSQAEAWNAEARSRGQRDWEIALRDVDGSTGDDLDDYVTPGWMARANFYRSRMLPLHAWDAFTRPAFLAFTAWKQDNYILDFTDLLERAIEQCTPAPAGALAMFVDEAQDMTPLMITLIRQWAAEMSTLTLVGDPDQCLYEWVGADPAIMHSVDPAYVRVLPRSYRLSRQVHAAALDWVGRTPGRVPVVFAPTDEEGEASYDESLDLRRPGMLLDDILADTEHGTVMVLASSAYMLRGLIAELRAEGVPFHNPWRIRNGAWNPMAHRNGVSTAQRLMAYCAQNSRVLQSVGRPWNATDVRTWVPMVKADGVFVRGGKKQLETMNEYADTPQVFSMLEACLEPDAVAGVFSGDPAWLYAHATADYKERMEYPMQVLTLSGGQALQQDPRIIIGTIHSVKGAEADTVYLAPDISSSALDEWEGGNEAAIRRTFYVGMSRARSKLVLMGSDKPLLAVDWDA